MQFWLALAAFIVSMIAFVAVKAMRHRQRHNVFRTAVLAILGITAAWGLTAAAVSMYRVTQHDTVPPVWESIFWLSAGVVFGVVMLVDVWSHKYGGFFKGVVTAVVVPLMIVCSVLLGLTANSLTSTVNTPPANGDTTVSWVTFANKATQALKTCVSHVTGSNPWETNGYAWATKFDNRDLKLVLVIGYTNGKAKGQVNGDNAARALAKKKYAGITDSTPVSWVKTIRLYEGSGCKAKVVSSKQVLVSLAIPQDNTGAKAFANVGVLKSGPWKKRT